MRSLLASGVLFVVAMAAPATSAGSTVLGSSLAPNGGSVQVGICDPLCTLIVTSVGSFNPVTSPDNGVVVSWATSSSDPPMVTSTARFRVLRYLGANHWIGAGTGPIEHTTAAYTTDSFTLKPGVPIQTGDYIGVDSTRDDSAGVATLARPLGPINMVFFGTPLADGGPDQVSAPTPGIEAYVQATVEPDADGDRFGDETQDQCLGTAGSANGCVPPPQVQGPAPAAVASTGRRAAALAKCKRIRNRIARKRCRKRALALPLAAQA
jgi:hypothetical protein